MKITLSQLRTIIKEELTRQRPLRENAAADEDMMAIYVAMEADGEDPSDFEAFKSRPEVRRFMSTRHLQTILQGEDADDYLHSLHDEFMAFIKRGEAGGLHVEEPIAPTNYPPFYRRPAKRRR